LPLWFLLASQLTVGAIWGSFVAAMCSRWPTGKSVATGRSHCDNCGYQIAAYDLVPIASYIVLKGKCRHCGGRIGLLALATELTAAVIGAVAVLLLPPEQGIAAAVFGWLLLPLIMLDYQHLWLPNRLVLLLAVMGVLAGPMLTPDIAWTDRATGVLAGFLSLEMVRQAFKFFRKHDGMGAGDPKLFGALGIWLGWQALPMTLLIASAIGLTVVASLHVIANHQRDALPFGSFLGVAAFAVVLMGC